MMQVRVTEKKNELYRGGYPASVHIGPCMYQRGIL